MLPRGDSLFISMKIPLDKNLRECVEQAHEETCLGRTDDLLERHRVFAEILAELEIAGAAMRYVDAKVLLRGGRLSCCVTIWKTFAWTRKPILTTRVHNRV
jgi:hypothetical protein